MITRTILFFSICLETGLRLILVLFWRRVCFVVVIFHNLCLTTPVLRSTMEGNERIVIFMWVSFLRFTIFSCFVLWWLSCSLFLQEVLYKSSCYCVIFVNIVRVTTFRRRWLSFTNTSWTLMFLWVVRGLRTKSWSSMCLLSMIRRWMDRLPLERWFWMKKRWRSWIPITAVVIWSQGGCWGWLGWLRKRMCLI